MDKKYGYISKYKLFYKEGFFGGINIYRSTGKGFEKIPWITHRKLKKKYICCKETGGVAKFYHQISLLCK